MPTRTLRHAALVFALTLVPAVVLVQTATVPQAQAMNFNGLEAKLSKLDAASAQFTKLAQQAMPSALTAKQKESWEQQSQALNAIATRLKNLHDKLNSLLSNAKDRKPTEAEAQAFNAHYAESVKQMKGQISAIVIHGDAAKTRQVAAQASQGTLGN